MSVINFKIVGVPATAVDATSDFTTDAFEFESSHRWAVALSETGLVGAPTFTVQVSSDKVKWYDWDALSTNVAIADSPDATYMSYRFMRVVYSANTASAGTINAMLDLTNNKF